MANFVLIHGSWHWGACYQKVAAELLLRGHTVAMPDMATHGFDTTPEGTVADMAQFTAPARRFIEAASEKVILVGHSMGGASLTYLGEQIPDRIAALVYLCAFMIPEGVAPQEYVFAPDYTGNPRAAELFQLLSPVDAGIKLDTSRPDMLKAAFYADCSDHDIAIARGNLHDVDPSPAFITPSGPFGDLRRVYIECTEDKAIPIEIQRKMQAAVPGAEVRTLNASHSPFFSQPAALAEILASIA